MALSPRQLENASSTVAGFEPYAEPSGRPSPASSGPENGSTDFLEHAGIAMHYVAQDGTILWANLAELNLLGYSSGEYIGRNVADFHVDPQIAGSLLRRLQDNQDIQGAEARLRRKDGSIRHVAISSTPNRESGSFIHARCITIDITPQKLAAESRERLVAIVECADDAILSKDLNGIIRSWNRGAERIFGYSAEEIVGKHISVLTPPDQQDEMPAVLEQLIRGERVEHYETRRRTKDGKIVTVSLTVSPIHDAAGAIVGASKVARDITQQRQSIEVQERLAAIVESSDDAILSKDLKGIIQSWNRGAEQLFGYTAREMIGKHISVLAPPDRVDEIPNILSRIARGERIDHYQTKRQTKDGRILTVSLTISAIRNAAGEIVGASKVVRDITERELQERALRESNAALMRANADLQQFAYSASHDLQEPLRMVSTYTELLRRKFGSQLGPEGDECIDYAVQGALRMEKLLQSLRDYTIASSEEPDHRTEADAGKCLEEALGNLETAIVESRATISRTPLPRVRLHHVQLVQLFQKLVGNSIRYRSGEALRIHVAATRRNTHWEFSIGDNGIGIDGRYKEQVFGLFKRLHGLAEYPGTGLGLAICQRIVERAGGRIWVESEPHRGSTFYFTLPQGDQHGRESSDDSAD